MAGLTVNPGEKNPRLVADTVRQVTEGKNNAVGTVTLNANATTTTVTAPSCAPTSVVLLMPQTQDAANDMATTSIVASSGQFTITHANNARVDRTFGWVVLG